MSGEGYGARDGRGRDLVIAALATVYTGFLLWAAGATYLLLCLVIIVPGTLLFVVGRREQRTRVFSPVEGVLFALALAGAVAAVFLLATGGIVL